MHKKPVAMPSVADQCGLIFSLKLALPRHNRHMWSGSSTSIYNITWTAVNSITPPEHSTNCAPSSKNLRIEITDTGEGLSKDQQSKLFSAFERLGAEHSSTKGSGIGLVIAKGLVENMAGAIGVHSEPGKGSTFWIELPTAFES